MISNNLFLCFLFLVSGRMDKMFWKHRHFPANGPEIEKSICFYGLMYLFILVVASEQTLWRY
ncbi:unnamed protein product [Arabidopsis halleri]